MIVGIDLETRSCADLKKVEAWAYSLHESTSVYCCVFGTLGPGGHKEFRWQAGDPVPRAASNLSSGKFTPLAHNSAFEKAIWTNVLTPRFGWPPCPDYFEDTQAEAAAANLPIKLGGLGAALGCPVQKDKAGHDLMLKMSRDFPGRVNPHDTPENRAKLLDYCATDVKTMLQCWQRVPKMNATERLVWALDQKINARGIYIDREFVARLQLMVDERGSQLRAETIGATDWGVSDSTATPALKQWLKDQGVDLPTVARVNVKGEAHSSESIGRSSVDELLEEDLDPRARAVLENRLEASRATSLAKLRKVEDLVDPRDGRLRNALQFCAAHPGRWSSRGLQIHNLRKDRREKSEARRINALVYAGDLGGLAAEVEQPLDAMSLALRGIVTAAPGNELIAADFSAKQARGIAWLAGQQDMLDAFADPNRDVYVESAAKSGSTNRDYGKLKVLAMGFGMGAVKALAEGPKYKLKDFTARDARIAVDDYRRDNPRIVEFWKVCDEQFKKSIRNPFDVFPIGPYIKVVTDDVKLRARLPSGRCIYYWRPSLRIVKKSFRVIDENDEVVETEPQEMEEIVFFTPGKDTENMVPESTYGGKIAENLTMGLERDCLALSLLRLEEGGYPPVIHVHDAIAAEMANSAGSVDEFCSIMATVPAWAPGLPIEAKGYRDVRFRG